MAKYLTISEAQQQLPLLPDELNAQPAIITRDGKPVMIAFSVSQFESLLETVEILWDWAKPSALKRNRNFLMNLQTGIKQADTGKTISLDELKAELDL
ncbi:MAG: type II toxin-antitoxin system Phd/YefM family antitoxin [Cyanobacteriota bacterium]|nr:type II toxin-antitoxin system Phd/YefM family antitoxin [Cyanobacteriota bacterium]